MNARWSDERLHAELNRLQSRYFPDLKGTVPVRHEALGRSAIGCFYADEKRIAIDLSRREHRSDRGIRATLLHELCHAVIGIGHGVKFVREIERLLMLGAPICEYFSRYKVSFAKFPECRRRYERQQQRGLMRAWRRECAWRRQRRLPILPTIVRPDPAIEAFHRAALRKSRQRYEARAEAAA